MSLEPDPLPSPRPVIFGLDLHSIICLFVRQIQTQVRKASRILAGLLGGAILVTCESPVGPAILSANLSRIWWILILSAASVSLVVLTLAPLLSYVGVKTIPARLLSALYLFCCPSLAVLSLPSSLSPSAAPPAWVGFAVPAMLLTSAWAYYCSLKYSDEEREGTPGASDLFEIEPLRT